MKSCFMDYIGKLPEANSFPGALILGHFLECGKDAPQSWRRAAQLSPVKRHPAAREAELTDSPQWLNLQDLPQ